MNPNRLNIATIIALTLVTLIGCGCDDDADTKNDSALPNAPDGSAQLVDASRPDVTVKVDGQVRLDAMVDSTSTEDAATQDATNDSGEDAGSDAGTDSAQDADEDDDGGEDESPVEYTLSVSVQTGGSVTFDPGDIDCTEAMSPCSKDFTNGTEVTLTAVPEEGYGFSHWEGDCQGGTTSTELEIDSEKDCSVYFVEITGDIAIDDPPTSVVPNVTEDTEKTLVFLERSEYELPDPLPFDSHIPGVYSSNPNTEGELPAGLVVNIYFLHFDPVGTDAVEHTASITFPEKILAIIFISSTLDETDSMVGRDDVIYPEPGDYTDRGLEFTSDQDTVTFHGDRKTISTDLLTSTVVDQIRIITATNGADVPFLTSSNVTVQSTPPESVVAGAAESNFLVAFEESSAITLSSDLGIDANAPGTYNSNSSLVTESIAAATVVNSYLVHFDPEGTTSTSRSGTITFERDILGVIVLSASLDASDLIIGSSTTTYPASGADTVRGYELGSNEYFRIAEDGRSIRVTANAQNGTDQIRVVLNDAP